MEGMAPEPRSRITEGNIDVAGGKATPGIRGSLYYFVL